METETYVPFTVLRQALLIAGKQLGRHPSGYPGHQHGQSPKQAEYFEHPFNSYSVFFSVLKDRLFAKAYTTRFTGESANRCPLFKHDKFVSSKYW